jgi:Tol biopolymer transport system component
VVVEIEEGSHDIWVYELGRGTLTRLTFQFANHWPIWAPDGKRVTFRSERNGPSNLYWKLADGSGPDERLTTSEFSEFGGSWSPDGKMLAFMGQAPATGWDIWVLELDGKTAKSRLFLQTPFSERQPAFSPDSRWLAYTSNESGRYEVYVQPYPGPGGKWQVSTEGGMEPVWARNGQELFYRNGDKMMAVAVQTRPSFTVGTAKMLFEGRYATPVSTNYDISADGQRFLMVKGSQQESAPTQLTVVLNWFQELKRLAPAGKK